MRSPKSQKKFSGPGRPGGPCLGCDVDGSELVSPEAEVAGEQKIWQDQVRETTA